MQTSLTGQLWLLMESSSKETSVKGGLPSSSFAKDLSTNLIPAENGTFGMLETMFLLPGHINNTSGNIYLNIQLGLE